MAKSAQSVIWGAAVFITIIVIAFLIIGKTRYMGSYENINLSMVKGDVQKYLESGTVFQKNYTGMECMMTPKYYYALSAVVVGVRDYYFTDNIGRLSPFDICVVWGKLGEKDVLGKMQVTMGYRHCSYGLTEWPIQDLTSKYVNNHLSNNHLIFPSDSMEQFFKKRIRRGSIVSMEGYLVDVNCFSGGGLSYTWSTSVIREDTKCEIVYLKNVIIDGEKFQGSQPV